MRLLRELFSAYPRGNARLGDSAWYRRDSTEPWERDWTVTRVGVKPFPYYFGGVTIEKHPFLRVVSPTSPGSIDSEAGEQTLIIPRSVPFPVSMVLAECGQLMPVRVPCNSPDERLQILCSACETIVFLQSRDRETADLEYQPTVASNCFLAVELTGHMMEPCAVCACEGRSYAIPYRIVDDVFEEDETSLRDRIC